MTDENTHTVTVVTVHNKDGDDFSEVKNSWSRLTNIINIHLMAVRAPAAPGLQALRPPVPATLDGAQPPVAFFKMFLPEFQCRYPLKVKDRVSSDKRFT